MKKTISILSLILCLTYTADAGQNVNEVILKTSTILNQLKSISYSSYREINNYKDNYFSKNSGACYFEYNSALEGGLARFQLRDNNFLQVYNGTEYFLLNHLQKTIEIERRTPAQLGNVSLLYNSITNIRIILPLLLKDGQIPKSLKDTSIDGKNYDLIQFALRKKSVEFPAGFSDFTIEITKYYKLIVDKDTNLPFMIFDSNSISKDKYYTKTVFSNIHTNVPQPEEKTWFFSSYPAYTAEQKAEQKPMIAVGAAIAPWALPNYGTRSDTLRSDQLKGKVVLMEFWIKNCGYCMAAFPDIKLIQEKYGKEVEVLSVNAYDKKEEIDFFFKREEPGYKMLYDGEALAKQLGITAYPATLLIDGSGKIIYTQEGFDHTKTEQAIQKAILH